MGRCRHARLEKTFKPCLSSNPTSVLAFLCPASCPRTVPCLPIPRSKQTTTESVRPPPPNHFASPGICRLHRLYHHHAAEMGSAPEDLQAPAQLQSTPRRPGWLATHSPTHIRDRPHRAGSKAQSLIVHGSSPTPPCLRSGPHTRLPSDPADYSTYLLDIHASPSPCSSSPTSTPTPTTHARTHTCTHTLHASRYTSIHPSSCSRARPAVGPLVCSERQLTHQLFGHM